LRHAQVVTITARTILLTRKRTSSDMPSNLIRHSLQACTLSFSLLFAFNVNAQEGKSEGKPLWELGVAGGAAQLPAYPGSADRVSRFLLLPYVVYRGEIFRADRDTAGARLIKTDDFEFDIGFGGSLGASSKEVAARQGMPSLGTSLEFGPRFKYVLSRPTADSRVTFALPVRTVIEFKGGLKQRGIVAEPEISFNKFNAFAGWGLSVTGSALFGNERVQNYLYGVPTQFATTARPAYAAKAGFIGTRFTVATSRSLSPESTLGLFARWENSSSAANVDSPLHLKSNGFSVGVGLTYTFAKSNRLVGN
jgi:MipA family protein